MRAWTFAARGTPSQVLKFRHDLPQPQSEDLKPNEVLVKVSHVGFFPTQASLMVMIPHFNDNPWFPGLEFSGTIVGCGDKTRIERNFNHGDKVFGMIHPARLMSYNGTLAEYIVMPEDIVSHLPDNMTMEEASGICGPATTDIGLAERAGLLRVDLVDGQYKVSSLAEGKKVLVTGGSTHTGLILLQLLKKLVGPNGTVVTTCSPRNVEAVHRRGADEIIDYTQTPDISAHLMQNPSEPFDAIFDIAGSDDNLYPRSPHYLKEDGYFAFAGNISRTHKPPGSGVVESFYWFIGTVSLVIRWQWQSTLPTMFGGIPRRAFFHSGRPTARNIELTRQLVQDYDIDGCVDSVWEMEDTLKVSHHQPDSVDHVVYCHPKEVRADHRDFYRLLSISRKARCVARLSSRWVDSIDLGGDNARLYVVVIGAEVVCGVKRLAAAKLNIEQY